VSAPAISIAFFDPAKELYGTARAGTTLLFTGNGPTALPEGPTVEQRGDSLRAELPGRFTLELEPVSEEANLGGVTARVCRVSGEVEGRQVDCLGTASETREAPEWEQLDAVRSLSILIDPENAVLAVARRPRGARGHGEELVAAGLLQAGELVGVEEARISTVYDGEGRQRSAGLELWLPGEDFPRRASGAVRSGLSLALAGLRVDAAIVGWRMEGRDGVGSYEITTRDEPPEAA
jgi:hypothetical protein